ncbi:MAG: chromate transporter [Elusimicrobiota bacterium]|jgi:chromate transporter|nr:chromate transporter [Elusimicrobiota bacterium]
MIYFLLYWEFLKIGLFAVGGGLATIPFLYQLSYKTAWFNAADIVNMFAISEVTPGPIGINMATFAGYHAAGVLGSLAATAGIITPPLFTVILIAKFINRFNDNKYFASAFKGMFCAVCALISVSVLQIAVSALINIKAVIFFCILLFAVRRFKAHPFLYICLSAMIGCFIKF